MGTQTRMKYWQSAGSISTPEGFALWLLVAIELGVQVALRKYFKKNHGG